MRRVSFAAIQADTDDAPAERIEQAGSSTVTDRVAARALADGEPVWPTLVMSSRYNEREVAVRGRYERIAPTLDERSRRLFAANETLQFGHGGLAAVARATGLARSTIRRGMKELGTAGTGGPPAGKLRKAGAGRKKHELMDPGLVPALRALVEPATRGDPESPLLWISKSASQIAGALSATGHVIGKSTTLRLLKQEGFTLQGTRKCLEGQNHPDRNKQFEGINELVKRYQRLGQPTISVDTKKKELVGPYSRNGRDWHTAGEGPDVLTHDFPNGVPKAVPYGVYDMARNTGWVSVGVSGDTAEFAVATIGRWWDNMGKDAYPDATDLLITADCGGSNGYRLRLWLLLLQQMANRTGLTISVAHLPPGTSKWNKIEHRLFSHITMNWRGQPLVSYEAVVGLIGNTTSRKGLAVRCELDTGEYVRGRRVTEEELQCVHVERDAFHGEWNYTVLPAPSV